MMRLPLLSAAALLFAAASASAQIRVDAKLGRHVRGSVTVGDARGHHDHDHHGRADRHDHRRRDHRGHGHGPRPIAPARGHWHTVEERVLVPGHWHEQHVPPTYGWIQDSCGHRRWGVVDAGGCRRVWVPGRWETRTRRVWVPC
jgi:hypothetical protein